LRFDASSLLRLSRLKNQEQLQILRLTTPELKKTFGAPFAQDDRHFGRSGYDGGFDFGGPLHQFFKDAVKLVEVGATGDEGASLEISAGDEIESFAAHRRGVVERRAQRDVAVVDAIGVEVDVGADCAATEEVDCTAFADHLNGFFPCFRNADCFDGNINAAIIGCKSTDIADRPADAAGLYNVFRAELASCFHLAIVLDDGDGFASSESSDVKHHKAKRTAADDGYGGAGIRS
jgi:hypothetical protein